MSLTSVIRYMRALDTSATDGSGKTGLAFGSITAKYLTQGGTLTALTTETITTLGTFQSPTDASHIRIKELNSADPTKGIYEVHFHDTQMASSGVNLWLFLSATGAMFMPLQENLTLSLPGVSGGLPVLDPNLTVGANVTLWNGADLLSAGQAPIRIGGCPSQSGMTSTQIKLDSGASSVDSKYKWNLIKLTTAGVTGAGQARVITAYNGTTRVATVDRAWDFQPDATTTFALYYASLPILDANGYTSMADLLAAAANKIADYAIRRAMGNVEVSANGDTLGDLSLYGTVMQLKKSNTTTNAGNLTIFKTDASVLIVKPLTTNAGADPVTGIS